jgi:hypothetical protein
MRDAAAPTWPVSCTGGRRRPDSRHRHRITRGRHRTTPQSRVREPGRLGTVRPLRTRALTEAGPGSRPPSREFRPLGVLRSSPRIQLIADRDSLLANNSCCGVVFTGPDDQRSTRVRQRGRPDHHNADPAPANAIMGRWVGSYLRELLDRMFTVNARHLRQVPTEYEAHFNAHRPHRSRSGRAATTTGRAPERTISRSSDVTDSAE